MNNKQMKQIAERVLEGMKANSDVGRWCVGVLMDAGVVAWDGKEQKYVEPLVVEIIANYFDGWHEWVYVNNKKVGTVWHSGDGSSTLETNRKLDKRTTEAVLSKCEEYYGKEFKEREHD